MVSLTPQQPSFYTRGKNNNAAASAQLTQQASSGSLIYNTKNYNPYQPAPGASYNAPNTTIDNFGYTRSINGSTIAKPQTTLLDTRLNSVASSIAGAAYGVLSGQSSLGPGFNRISTNGLPYGAQFLQEPDSQGITSWSTGAVVENRVMIRDQTGKFIGGTVTKPLAAMQGVVFPYVPTITVSHKAQYDMDTLVHTNYHTPTYVASSVDSINITAQFTAQNATEAAYVMAMMHFFRSVTKMFYGLDSLAGTPPPVLYLDGHGKYMFDHIPVVISSFNYSLPADVDYISTQGSSTSSTSSRNASSTTAGTAVMVPAMMQVTVDCIPTYSRTAISTKFGLANFAAGTLVTSGTSGARAGGFI